MVREAALEGPPPPPLFRLCPAPGNRLNLSGYQPLSMRTGMLTTMAPAWARPMRSRTPPGSIGSMTPGPPTPAGDRPSGKVRRLVAENLAGAAIEVREVLTVLLGARVAVDMKGLQGLSGERRPRGPEQSCGGAGPRPPSFILLSIRPKKTNTELPRNSRSTGPANGRAHGDLGHAQGGGPARRNHGLGPSPSGRDFSNEKPESDGRFGYPRRRKYQWRKQVGIGWLPGAGV